MGERLRTTAGQHPGLAVGVLAALAVLGTALAAGATDRLILSTIDEKAPILRIHAQGDLPAGSAPFGVAMRTMRAQISADPAVRAVRIASLHQGANSELLLVRFKFGGRKRDAALTRIERNLDPGPLRLDFRGPAAAVGQAKDEALDDLVFLLAALPLTAAILALTIGLRGAGAALLAAGAAASIAALSCELLAGVLDVAWLSLVGAAAAGILVTLQLSALGVAGAPPGALLCAGGAAAIAFGATAVLGIEYLASLALGGGLGALFAVPVSIVAAAATRAGNRAPGLRAGGLWGGIAGPVGFHRGLAATFAVFALLMMLIAVAPVDHLATAAIGAAAAPTIGEVELAAAAAAALLATLGLAMIEARRFWLPLLATLAAGVPALATAGLLVVTFQDGGLEGALGYTSSGAVAVGSVGSAVAIVAALGAAQAVSLAWAARETEGLRPDEERVIAAVRCCVPAAAVSCVTGLAAGVALGFGSASFEKEFGLAIAAGMALQLFVVASLLAPALLRVSYRTAPDQ